MPDRTTKWVVYDHSSGHLQDLAEAQDFSVITSAKMGGKADKDAASQLSNMPEWRLAFLHIHDEPWESVIAKAPAGSIAIRFSRVGFPPQPAVGTNSVAAFCNPCIRVLDESEISSLVTVLSAGESYETIKQGYVPRTIRHLVSFAEPSRLLELQGWLKHALQFVAGDPANPNSAAALNCLGQESIRPAPPGSTLTKKIIRESLGSADSASRSRDMLSEAFAFELCCRDLENEYPEISELVDTVCSGDEELDPAAAIAGYRAVEEILR